MKRTLQLLAVTSLMSTLSIPCFASYSDFGALQEYNDSVVTKIDKSNVFSPASLGTIALYHTHRDRGFIVEKESDVKKVQRHFIEKILRDIKPEDLKYMLNANGYIKVGMNNEGDYTLGADGRLRGGGPLGYAIGYGVGQALCYTVPAFCAKLGIVMLTGNKKVADQIPLIAIDVAGAYAQGQMMKNVTQGLGSAALSSGLSDEGVRRTVEACKDSIYVKDIGGKTQEITGERQERLILTTAAAIAAGGAHIGAVQTFSNWCGGIMAVICPW